MEVDVAELAWIMMLSWYLFFMALMPRAPARESASSLSDFNHFDMALTQAKPRLHPND